MSDARDGHHSYFRKDLQMLLAAKEGKNIVHFVKYNNNKAKTLNLKIQKIDHLNHPTLYPLSIVRPEFFYFSFYRPSRPNFLEIEKKIKEIFFQFYFFISLRLMPVQYWSSNFVFSTAARLINYHQ